MVESECPSCSQCCRYILFANLPLRRVLDINFDDHVGDWEHVMVST